MSEPPSVTRKLQEYADFCAAHPELNSCLAVRWVRDISERDSAIAALMPGIETLSVGRATVEPDRVLLGGPQLGAAVPLPLEGTVPDLPAARGAALVNFSCVIPRERILDVRTFETMAGVNSKELFQFMWGGEYPALAPRP